MRRYEQSEYERPKRGMKIVITQPNNGHGKTKKNRGDKENRQRSHMKKSKVYQDNEMIDDTVEATTFKVLIRLLRKKHNIHNSVRIKKGTGTTEF